MRKMTLLAIVLVLIVALTACGKEEAPETTAATVAIETAAPTETTAPPQPLDLTEWTMSATTWSSPNGATIHISATPNYYEEGHKADFIVRLESDDVAVIPCQWDGTVYTASADLNAANGYLYYMLLTAADGTTAEVAVNTPEEPVNEAYLNLETALQSYCSIVVEDSTCEGKALTLTTGLVQVQTPAVTTGDPVTCQEVALVLSYNGQEVDKKVLTMAETDTTHLYEADLADISFTLPEMEAEEKVELTLAVTLTNGHSLSAYGGNWILNSEEILPVVG